MSSDRHATNGNDARSGDPMIGRLLEGRYRISGRVARGGMASVYEATDLRLDRTVAIKIMHAGLGEGDDFATRFVREARSAAKLSHPNVVSVYDQGNDDGVVFLAMEFISGHTLRDTITKEAPMSPSKALALIEPILSALSAAHRAQIIHRDIKPENVLIADDGRIKVADFGLAKAISADTQHTATAGVLIGTVSYLAPELVIEGRADARADVYAVGVVLFELLTGTKPHEGETPIQVAYKHVHDDVPAPSSLISGLPEYVDALVARATARDRGQRPADASVLLHQVHRVSHALAAGVREDPELTQDLALTSLSRPLGDTTPEPWDEEEMATLLAPTPVAQGSPDDREYTVSYPASMPPPSAPPTTTASGPKLKRPAKPPRGKRSKKGPLLFLLALILACSGGGAAYWFGFARYTTAPGVLGMEQSVAEAKLDVAGLGYTYEDPTYSETVPAGAVISTDPAAGSRVLRDGFLTLQLSLGKERYDVPKVAGMTEDEAQDALLGVRLAYDETIEKYSENVAAGIVISSTPAAGTTLRPGAAVDLIISKGRKPIKVGDWVGKDIDDVRAAYEKRGLVLDVTSEEFSDDVDKGSVISQNPRSGTVFRGDAVSFVVSKGPELVEVPSVRAFGVRAATERLEDLGFEVEVESRTSNPLGFVFSTDPGSGEMVPKGSTITLNVV